MSYGDSGKRIESVAIVGGGSAGLLTALALRQCAPSLSVRLFRSKLLGVIGVGEGTTPPVLDFLHVGCQIPIERFIQKAAPTIKLGLRFDWGTRSYFNYSFGSQTTFRHQNLKRHAGFFCWDDFTAANPVSCLMDCGKAFANHMGNPVWNVMTAYHIYNPTFVEFLENECQAAGVEIVDALLEHIEVDDHGVKELLFDQGRKVRADLYIDASGFKSLLLGGAMKAAFVDFSKSLYCDRAVVGLWDRTSEPILPYTRCETMDAGWCWQIEHEHHITRGYVYSSQFISDQEAELELRKKNPKIGKTNSFRFQSGYFAQSWVKNVVAIGNACGFVEPLESTALMIICGAARRLGQLVAASNQTPTRSMRAMFNSVMSREWESIRGFLAIHYRYNHRLDTNFWRACRADVELGQAREFVDFYTENGPIVVEDLALLSRNDIFGLEGHLTMMVGQRVPHRNHQPISPAEWNTWRLIQARNREIGLNGIDNRQVLDGIRSGNMHFVLMNKEPVPLR